MWHSPLVLFQYDFIYVPIWSSLFVFTITSKISFLRDSFQNDFIPVIALNGNVPSGTKPGRTLCNYHAKEVRTYIWVHSGTEVDKWIGWTDHLTSILDPLIFLCCTLIPEWELLCKLGMKSVCHNGEKAILVSRNTTQVSLILANSEELFYNRLPGVSQNREFKASVDCILHLWKIGWSANLLLSNKNLFTHAGPVV